MNYEITIIVPIYNAQKYIRKCIDSILKQTYKNFQLILINDGSTDKSLEICKEYKELDNRVKLIDKVNEGVSIARNVGIKNAEGDYIVFIDADDYIEKNYLEKLIQNKKYDFVMCSYKECLDGKIKKIVRHKENEFCNNQEVKNMVSFRDIVNSLSVPWMKMFKRDIIYTNSILFKENISYGEDTIFVLEYLANCKNAKILSDSLYNYNITEGSLSRKYIINIKDKLDNIIEVLQKNKYSKKTINMNLFRNIRTIIFNERLSEYRYFYISCIECSQIIKDNKLKINEVVLDKKGLIIYIFLKLQLYYVLYLIIRKGKMKNNSLGGKMKSIGIVTINDNDNYGNRLLNYAVQEVLKQNGHKVVTLKNNSIINSRDKFMLRLVKYQIKNIKKRYKKKSRRNLEFEKFNKNIVFSKKYVTPYSKVYKKYDYFITGSDQVWNPNFGRLRDVDLLSFAKPEQRIAFSASFAIAQLPEECKNKAKKELEKFKAISVREDRGKEIVEELTERKDVQVLVDPTMLLTSEEWDKVEKKPEQLKTDKYILNYFLGEMSEKRKKEIERIAKENNCEIINILDKNSPFYQTGPSEFLYLEKNAFLICTDSFHSCVFAILYNRPFVVFDREDSNEKMNSRLDTLLKKFKLQDRWYKDKITEEQLLVDYKESYIILGEERKKAKEFLENAIK